MDGFRIPIGTWVAVVVDWVVNNLAGPFGLLRSIFVGMFNGVDWVLSTPSPWVVVAVFGIIGLLARGWLFGVLCSASLVIIIGVDQWDNSMDTLALVLVSAFIAILIAIPLGIAAARSPMVWTLVRPILDLLQTMPAFVYLIPALLLFRVGVAPGIVATILFALAPGVRLTHLGIREVDHEVVEAGEAFGASSWRILRQIQLPLAMPSIMAGVNQVIMLSLSMVVIAGMVGGGGLGGEILRGLNRLDTALGVEAGLCVVILAILLDRLSGAFGMRRGLYNTLRTARSRRTPGAPLPADTTAGGTPPPPETTAGGVLSPVDTATVDKGTVGEPGR